MSKSWERVLQCWRVDCGHVGLTIHALAAITEQNPHTILSNLADNPKVYGQFCHDIKAPVWSINSMNSTGDEARRKPYVILSEWLLEKIPYPQYKSVRNMQGVKEIVGVSQANMARLRAAIKNKDYLSW